VCVEPVIGYRLWQLRAAAFLRMQRPKEALESASRALDIDPKGIRALVNAAFGAALTGELETARSFAERAIASGPDEPRAWGARLYVAAAAGEALPVAPTSVAASDYYRTVQAEIAFNQQNWDQVVTLTDSILKTGTREPGVLHLRVAALVSREANSGAAPVREHSTDAERLATELIDGGERDNPQFVQVLVLRAVARRQLGRPAEAEADLAEAQRLDGSDLDAIRNAVDLKLETGDDEGALQLLRNPSVDSAPFLLAIRARLFILEGDRDAGRQDIEAALRGITTAPEDQATRLAIADSALALDDVDLASRVLEGFGPDTTSGVGAALLAGRISFAQGDVDKGLAMYREAVARDQRHGSDYLAELAMRLRRAGRLSEAIATFEEAGIEGLDDEPLREYVASAMQANDLARAQRVIDPLLGHGEPPPWALAVATDIALRSDDQDNAIRHLGALIAGGHATSQIRISLAKSLWESERFDDAEREIGLLLAMPDADPVDSMQAAELLHAIGRDEKALRVAYDSFRRAHEDPLMHRAFGRIFLLSKVELPKPEVVGPETHVRLRDQHGKELEHTIFTIGPVEPLRGEITVEDAQRLGLIGKRAGDVIVRNEGHWTEERQDVVEVLPAIVHAGRDVTFNFNQRFPSEPSFATAVHVGEMESPRDLAPLLGSLVERRSTAGEVFDLYRQRTLPLGAVVRILGGSIPEVMDHASRDPVVGGPLPVEWSDEAGWTSSRNNAANATQVILTRSALHTASELDIRDAIVAGYTFTAPRSLQTEMRQELREAEQYVRDGRRTMMATDQGFGIVELEAGSAPLEARAEALRSLLGWVNDHVSIEPRPLELVRAAGSRQDQERDFVGHSSYDGLALARHHNSAIYADDLGLRRGAIEGVRPPSFSTVAALYALTERGLIDQRLRDHAVVTLTVRHYVSIRPTPEILMAALSRTPALQRSELGTVFGLLGSGAIRADEAASVVAQTLRAASIAPLHVASPEVVTELALDAMTSRWPATLSATLVVRAATTTLTLLPQAMEAVRNTCAEYVVRKVSKQP
jgi:tetratricopeptide (TPR) repeat protein